MKVVPAVREGEPEEGRSSGGYRAGGGLNHHCSPRTRERRKALEAGTVPWRRWVKLRAGGRCKRQEGNGGRRARAASREGKTLKSEPWTWQRGETNPQDRWRRKPSRACETPRTERSGPGTPAIVDSAG